MEKIAEKVIQEAHIGFRGGEDGLVWLCHKSGRSLKLKGNLRRFRVRLETKKLFDFNHLTINPTMFMTQSYELIASSV